MRSRRHGGLFQSSRSILAGIFTCLRAAGEFRNKPNLMRFSLCIPNYNYAQYVGDTIKTVLDQDEQDFEIVVSDNASSDRSIDVIQSFGDQRIRLHVNACNIGFGGNLDRVTRMASGDLMFFLPSDDQLRPGALSTYGRLYDLLGSESDSALVTASCDIIDGQSRKVSELRPDPVYWR